MWITRVFLLVVITFIIVNAKKYDSRCKLVRDLLKSGMQRNIFFGQWVCLIEAVSKRDTSAFMITPGGKKMYGLYQIPGRWCREGKPGGDCNIACELLLDDEIADDTACADTIFHREGFKYWPLWVNRCKNKVQALTMEIYKCPGLLGKSYLENEFTRYERMLNYTQQISVKV